MKLMKSKFAYELLRWAVCCGDLYRSSFGLMAHPMITNSVIIALCARSLLNVINTAKESSNQKPYLVYVSSMLSNLRSMAENLETPCSAIFWIAIECLEFNNDYIYKSSLEILEYYLTQPKCFTVLNKESDYDKQAFSKNDFWMFHSQWHQIYSGCSKVIYEHEINDEKIATKVIHIINYLIQIKYISLFSNSPDCMYTALLSLLPWMWYVFINDISKFNLSTDDVVLMKTTIKSFISLIHPNSNQEKNLRIERFKNYLSDVFEDIIHVDIYSVMLKICKQILQLMDKTHLLILCKFFTSLLKKAQYSLKIPLYSLVAFILKKENYLSKYLVEFASIVKEDQKPSRSFYIDLFMSEYNKCKQDEQIISVPSPLFPKIVLIPRIIAVTAPELTDFVDKTDFEEFDNLLLYPSLIPQDDSVKENEKIKKLTNEIKKIKIHPFYEQDETLRKLHFSIYENKNSYKRSINCEIDVDTILRDTIKEYNKENRSLEDDLSQNVSKVNEEEGYQMIILDPMLFVPSQEEVNRLYDEIEDKN